MELFLSAVNVIAVILMILILFMAGRQQPSRSQNAFMLYDIFTIMFVIGIQMELIYSDTVGAALSGLGVQYAGQCGFLIALLWFVSEFAQLKIPWCVYTIQIIINIITMWGVITCENHTYFYRTMEILKDGMYNRIYVTGGIIWYLHYAHLILVFLSIFILCGIKYKRSSTIQKKRIRYIVIGIGATLLELILKTLGLFGSYNPIVCALAITTLCMMVALVRFGYFGSLNAAVNNAFNHGDEGLLIVNYDNIVIFVNKQMNKIYPELKNGDRLINQQEIIDMLNKTQRIISRGQTSYELRTEDIIENGEKSGTMLWFINQTQQLNHIKELRQASEAKTHFLMKVSHELRTPLNTIMGMNEIIIRESREENITGYAQEAKDAAKAMLDLVNEVLDVSAIETGRVHLKNNPFSIDELLMQAENMIRTQAENKGLRLIVNCNMEPWERKVLYLGDFHHILQAVTNILQNAVKYTDIGTVALSVTSVKNNKNEYIAIAVSDTGIGIPENEQKKIFDSFERSSQAIAQGREGIGLGLAIVSQLVSAMGGKITLDSKEDKGSIFTIFLPRIEAEEGENEGIPELETECDMEGRYILAVDDNEKNLMVLKHLLKNTKSLIDTAANGYEGVNKCRYKTYDMIFLDHMMPEPDGIETLHMIREDMQGKNNNTKIIALTANVIDGAKEMYLQEGFQDYLTKPVMPHKLEEMLKKFLGRDRNFFEILSDGGINTEKGMAYSDDDVDFYISMLRMFPSDYNKNQRILNDYYDRLSAGEESVYSDFTILAHSLKAEALGIGAGRLGELCYKLELAGKEHNIDIIDENYNKTLFEWKRIANLIKDNSVK